MSEIVSGANSILVVANDGNFAIQVHNKHRYYGWIFRKDAEGWLANSIASWEEVAEAKNFVEKTIHAEPRGSLLRAATTVTVPVKPQQRDYTDPLQYEVDELMFRIELRRRTETAEALRGRVIKSPWARIHEEELMILVRKLDAARKAPKADS